MDRRPIQPGVKTESEAPVPDLQQLRDAFAQWATGVTVVTVTATPPRGITVTAFCPVSLRPPTLLVSIDRDAPVLPILLERGRFTVSILAADQRAIATAFADRFPVGRLPLTEPDAIVEGALASFVCSAGETMIGGDHMIVTGRIERVVTGEERPALLHHRRRYHTFG